MIINKKRGGIIVAAFVLLLAAVLIVNPAPDDIGCCTAPGHLNICEQMTESECCGSDTICINDYFLSGQECGTTELCTSTVGCCVDSCFQVQYKADCIDRDQFAEGTCTSQPECQQGCCVCMNIQDNSDLRPIDIEVTLADCEFECGILPDYQFYYFNGTMSLEECNILFPPPPPPLLNATIRAIVIEAATGDILEGVQISAGQKSCLTDENGECSMILPLGNYDVAASKSGYTAQIQPAVLSQEGETFTLNFALETAGQAIISGKVTKLDGTTPIGNARIYTNGILKAATDPSTGTYSFSIETGQHTLQAKADNYHDSEQRNIVLTTAGITQNFMLTPLEEECAYPLTKPIPSFTVNHIPGVRGVEIKWTPPEGCTNIAGYYLNKSGNALKYLRVSREPPEHPTSYIDYNVKWRQAYQYCISVEYDDNIVRQSDRICLTITLGDSLCEGKYIRGKFIEFCRDVYNRAVCDNSNNIVMPWSTALNPADCSTIGISWFCSGPDFNGRTSCKDQGPCNPLIYGLPFGIGYNKDECEADGDNYCYFDSSGTVVDQCFACYQGMSCYDYDSEEACLTDNCDAAGYEKECKWLDTPYAGVGKGICYIEDYPETDKCSKCSRESPLFENTQCTMDVCSALGDCFPDSTESSCGSCLEGGCDYITTESACIGEGASKQSFSISPDLKSFTLSNDACGHGRCKWDSVSNKCFKDGNDNDDPDCDRVGSDQVAGGSLTSDCIKDNTPPTTTPEEKRLVINYDSQMFLISDEDASKLSFCYDIEGECIPDEEVYFVNGVARLRKDDILKYSNLLSQVDGDFVLRYYATDIYHNQEQLRSAPFYGDIKPPILNVSMYFIGMISESPVLSKLIFDIDVSETATCTDELIYIDERCGQDESSCYRVSKLSERGNSWNIQYDVPDGIYKYRVRCADDANNVVEFVNETIEVDAFRYVLIIKPKWAIHDTSVEFEVETLGTATCELHKDQFKFGDFTTANQLRHVAGPFALNDNTYYNNFRVVCTDIQDPSIKDIGMFYFTIDNLAPVSTITIDSGQNYYESNNTVSHFWLSDEAVINFRCSDSKIIGEFGCDANDVKYCVTDIDDTCTPNLNYVNSLLITTTKKIMYKGIDNGGNEEEVKESIIHMGEDIGIFLIQPPYAFSKESVFDVIIQTQNPSLQCKFSGADFDFEQNVDDDLFFTMNLATTDQFIASNFPARIGVTFANEGDHYPMHVKCKDENYAINDQPAIFDLTYDPTPPRITLKEARPNPVLQGPNVLLYVETDDMTICKLDRVQINYDLMNLRFEGWDGYGKLLYRDGSEPEFRYSNEHSIAVSSADDGRTITYNVACQNKAGDISPTEIISYTVDFSGIGNIIRTAPSGSINYTDVILEVETSRDAICEVYDGNWITFSETGKTIHTRSKDVGGEGNYHFPVKCTMSKSQAVVNGEIRFSVDQSAPTMISIDDGNISCGGVLRPVFDAEDEYSDISYYNYSVWDSSENMIFGWNIASTNNPLITLTNFTIGGIYHVRAGAIDALGYTSSVISGDGFTVIDPDSDECALDNTPPTVTLDLELTYKGMKVTMNCIDDTGCDEKYYGIRYGEGPCNATNDYTNPVYMTTTGDFCWNVSDVMGNIATGSQLVQVNDSDGDGVPDDKDKCPDTPTGELVDEDGCSANQKEDDDDGDGVPNNRDLCLNTPLEERYDVDEDGCGPSERDEDEDGVPNDRDLCPNTATGEEVDEDGCSSCQKDTDGDGMVDCWEERQGLDPNDPSDALPDYDGDKLSNREEYEYYKRTGREIMVFMKDTDDDGFDDKEEIDAGTNPIDPRDYPERRNGFAIFFLILGLILLIFGIVYTVYLNYREEKEKPIIPQAPGREAYEARRRVALLEQQRRAYEARRRAYEQEMRRKSLERVSRIRAEKERKRKEAFEAFEGKKKEKPKVLPGRVIHPETKKSKEAAEFKRLVELTEEKTARKQPIIKIEKPPKEPAEFERLADLVEERLRVHKERRVKELSPKERAEISDIFARLAEMSEGIEKKKAIENLREFIKAKKKGTEPEKSTREIFKEVKKIGKKKTIRKKKTKR